MALLPCCGGSGFPRTVFNGVIAILMGSADKTVRIWQVPDPSLPKTSSYSGMTEILAPMLVYKALLVAGCIVTPAKEGSAVED
eukprot:scaffold18657_cov19-Tisochrysis_lutea.AAC.1